MGHLKDVEFSFLPKNTFFFFFLILQRLFQSVEVVVTILGGKMNRFNIVNIEDKAFIFHFETSRPYAKKEHLYLSITYITTN